MIEALGPEPLGNAFDGAMLAAACAGKKTSLKAALSDQKVVAGLGNIYVCEALHRAHLSPKRQASTIATRSGAATPRAGALADAIKAVLNDAIQAGGSSLRDHRQTDGDLGYFQHSFRVYDRAGDEMPDAEMQGHDQAHRAGDALDVFLSGVPEVARRATPSRYRPMAGRGSPLPATACVHIRQRRCPGFPITGDGAKQRRVTSGCATASTLVTDCGAILPIL